ncbi:hypothetical protein [Pikeienuella sp. HZG-20]
MESGQLERFKQIARKFGADECDDALDKAFGTLKRKPEDKKDDDKPKRG